MPFIHTNGLKATRGDANEGGSTQGIQGEDLYFQVDMSDLFSAATSSSTATHSGIQTGYPSRDMSVTIDLAEERCWATVDNPSYSFHAYTSLKIAIDDCVSVLEDIIAMQTLLLEGGDGEKIHCLQLMSGHLAISIQDDRVDLSRPTLVKQLCSRYYQRKRIAGRRDMFSEYSKYCTQQQQQQ